MEKAMSYYDPLKGDTPFQVQQPSVATSPTQTIAAGSGTTFGFDSGATLDLSAAGVIVLYTYSGIVQLDLSQVTIITSNAIDTQAHAAGLPASNTNPTLQRSNGATDKSLVLSWAASNSQEVQFPGIVIPPDCNIAQAVIFNCLADMSGATDTPVLTLAAFEGVGGTNLGAATVALSATLALLTVSLTLTAYPNFLSLTLTPGTHTTNAVNLYAAWLTYVKQ